VDGGGDTELDCALQRHGFEVAEGVAPKLRLSLQKLSSCQGGYHRRFRMVLSHAVLSGRGQASICTLFIMAPFLKWKIEKFFFGGGINDVHPTDTDTSRCTTETADQSAFSSYAHPTLDQREYCHSFLVSFRLMTEMIDAFN
jgi:hypothetical protein